jgi:hypothetical protein
MSLSRARNGRAAAAKGRARMTVVEDSGPPDSDRTIVDPQRSEPQGTEASGVDAPHTDITETVQLDPEQLRAERRQQDARDALLAAVRLVASDELFDERFYGAASGIGGDRADLVAHYLTLGEAACFSPSRAQGSPHFILLNSTILFDVYMLGKICIMNAVLRGHSLKSVDADALAEMRSG